MLKSVKVWPLTEDGWADAWSYLEAHQPSLAVAGRYAADAARAEAARNAESQEPEGPAAEVVTPGETPGTKVCTVCAEEVKLAAVMCRYCGHQFSAASDNVPTHTFGRFAAAPQTSWVAVTAFAFSVIGLWMVGLPLGVHGEREIDESDGRLTGRGFATAGVVFGAIWLVVWIIVVIVIALHSNSNNCGGVYCTTVT
jgi:Uncharacterised protein family UPF0547